MKIQNIRISDYADIDESTSINNVDIHSGVKIAKNCSVFGSEQNPVEIGRDTYIGMNCCINGFKAGLKIGRNVSIAQNVSIMTDSGPNASAEMQSYYPIEIGEVSIGDHSWVGANVVILPNVHLGKFCVVAANSVVKNSFDSFSVIGGSPAKFIKSLKK
tara:strand:- start:409 stop:885 length:477 start_codon:yes stop_codon:yes gene_type:complete